MKQNSDIILFKDTNLDKLNFQKVFKKKRINKNFVDYSQIIVRKPWGYEYLIFQNKNVAVWILYVKKKHETSMHCHPQKKTSLIVLDGNVTSLSLEHKNRRKVGQGIIIDKKVFHKTINSGIYSATIMEVETPNIKHDLLRLKDIYGRVNQGYEKQDKFSVNTNNYNYISLDTARTYHNVTKKIGSSSITFVNIKNITNLKLHLKKHSKSLYTILEGSLKINSKKYAIADTFEAQELIKIENKISLEKNILFLVTTKDDKNVKTSDLLIDILENQNINKAFIVPGESNLHLLDSLGKKEKFEYMVFSNEFYASYASLGYSKLFLKPPVMIISAGNSPLKVIEAVYSAYIDSEALVILSGQQKKGQNTNFKLRQLGSKSIDIIKLIKSITNYSATINNINDVAYHLEKAIYLSKHGRPGPVWLDIPIDILGKTVKEDELKHFDFSEINENINFNLIERKISKIYKFINSSKRPVLLLGYGVRISSLNKEVLKLINKLKIPVFTSRRGSDLINSENKYFFGRPGVYGNRYSNILVQKSDLLISIGSRLSIPLIGRRSNDFARNAKKIIIDVDPQELLKNTIKSNLSINVSADIFIDSILKNTNNIKSFETWISKCKKIKKELSFINEGYAHNKKINPYLFINDFSKIIPENSVIFMDGDVIMNYVMQSFEIKKNQRLITASGLDNDGFSLQASLGLSDLMNYVCAIVICDESSIFGSFEHLQNIIKTKLPIKIIALSGIKNIALRNSQKDFFGGRYVATEKNQFSKFLIKKLPYKDLGIKFSTISNSKNYLKGLIKIFKNNYPEIISVEIDPNHKIIPKMGFSIKYNGKWIPKHLEDMYPFLNNERLKSLLKE